MNVPQNSKAKHPRSHAVDYSCPFLPCDANSFFPLISGICLFINLFQALIFKIFFLKNKKIIIKKSRKHTKCCTREFSMYDFLWKNDAGLLLTSPFFKIRSNVVSDRCAACEYFYFLLYW